LKIQNVRFNSLARLTVVLLVTICTAGDAFAQDDELKWFRGNLHTHSFWSDGNDFPEMITKWYAGNGYHFLALTDHNILSRGDKWILQTTIEDRAGESALEKYLAAFGEDWVETRVRKKEDESITEVRLRGLDEFRSKFESPGKFLMIESEEISDRAEGVPIHMNATNLKTLISPVGGETTVEAINNNLRAAEEQAEKNGEPILVHLNHPNFGWAVTAEEMARVTNERFFEVYNGHPSINHLGDKTRPSVEKMWDIANTIRIGELNAKPMLGLATDDSHHYHDQPKKDAVTGRGWVMVQAKSLDAVSLIEAMNEGRFYSSSGVELESVQFDAKSKTLKLAIKPQPGLIFTTEFIGTMRGYDKTSTAQLDSNRKPIRSTRIYSKDVGKVFLASQSLTPEYELTGEELFVRAVITSSKKHPRASFKGQKEQAWTQPVGWK
jgi:hypothetical protein